MGRERSRERDIARNKSSSPRSKDRSVSRSYKRRSSESDRRSRSYERRRNDYSSRGYDRNRRSRSPYHLKYKKKTSRDNSSENAGNTVYVNNLSKKIQDDEIRDKFSRSGKIIATNIVRDPFTKESRGFGFITYETDKEAIRSIEDHNKTDLDGKLITVELSKRNKPHNPTPGIYLGPNSATTKSRRNSSPYYKRRERSRSRSRSRSFRNRRRNPHSRSRSNSRNKRR